MYPLPIILVNCPDRLRSQVRRELGNHLALLKGEYRNVDGVVQRYQCDADEHFLLMMYVSTPEDLKQLQRLSSAFPQKPILALRDRDADQTLFHSALRAGAAFAIPAPVEREDLITALNWIARQLGYSPPPSLVLAVAGVNGGCGATSVALNLASEIASRHGRHVILMELALRIGMLATYLHIEPTHTILNILDHLDDLDIEVLQRALTPINDHLAVLAGPQQAIHSSTVASADVLRVVAYARPLADVIVLDVPCTYDNLYFEVLTAADHVILLWEQKIPSVRALRMVRDALQLRQSSAERQTLVLNRYDAKVPGFGTADLQQLLGIADVRTITNDWAGMSAAINDGVPLRVKAPHSRALADIDALADTVLGIKPAATAEDRPNLFGRLVRAFGLTS